MSHWSWVLGEAAPSSVKRRELTQALARSVTFQVDGTATAAFSLDGRHDEATEIEAFATDLHVIRDGESLFRGRIGAESDSLTGTNHLTQFTAIDYRGMLEYRTSGEDGMTFTATDQATIAFDMIDNTQDRDGGDWGITSGVGGTSGVTRDRVLEAGKPILADLEDLGRLDSGFEWTINPDLELDRWYPWRGADNGRIVDYGGLAASATRSLATSRFGNAVILTGGTDLAAVALDSADVDTDPRGRWELSEAATSIVDQATLDDRATWLLEETRIERPTWAVSLHEGRWEGPSHIGIGDIITWVAKSGRLQVVERHRVVELKITLNENSTESVDLGLLPVLEGS